MIVLTATTDRLEVVLAATITTSQLQCYAAWRDVTTSAYTPGRTVVSTNNTSDVSVVAAPAASTQRVVDHVSIFNSDTAAATVRVKFDANTDEKTLVNVTLQPGWSLCYDSGAGWQVRNASGGLVSAPIVYAAPSSVLVSPFFSTAALTSVKTITSGSSFAVLVGKAPRALTSVVVRSRVTTAMATITWGEVAIAKGAVNVGGNPTLTVVGFADVSASFNSVGQKSTTVNVSAGQAINEGDELWVVIGNAATTAAVMRAMSIADDLQVGLQASVASRPSTIVGAPTAFTIEGATTLGAWVALVV